MGVQSLFNFYEGVFGSVDYKFSSSYVSSASDALHLMLQQNLTPDVLVSQA